MLLTTLFLPAASFADDFDLALHSRDVPVGELSGHTELGPIALAVRHSEYLGYLNRDYQDEAATENPLARRTEIQAAGAIGLESGDELPFGVSVALDQWDRGDREVHVTGRSGLNLNGLRFGHSLTVTTRFAADGTETRRGSGRFSLRGNFLGGEQEGVVEYDAMPLTQVTRVGIRSDWRFQAGGAVLAGLDHRPVTRISEARLGFRQPIGPFDMTSNFIADSAGAYSLGISFSLDLGTAPEATSWRLSSTLAALRAERRALQVPAPRTFLEDD